MSFASDLKDFNKHTENVTLRVRNTALLALFGAIVRDTPVLTGDLRNNWQIGLEDMNEEVIKGKYIRGQQLSGYMESLNKAGWKQIFFFNNLPYAWRIEYAGWSKKKAPQGMVVRNVERFGRLVSRIAKQVL